MTRPHRAGWTKIWDTRLLFTLLLPGISFRTRAGTAPERCCKEKHFFIPGVISFPRFARQSNLLLLFPRQDQNRNRLSNEHLVRAGTRLTAAWHNFYGP